jgi:hypothetical protein
LGSTLRKQEARNVTIEMWLPACISGETRSIEAMASVDWGHGGLAFVLKVSRKVKNIHRNRKYLLHRCGSLNTVFLLFVKKSMITLYISSMFVESRRVDQIFIAAEQKTDC